MTKFDIRLRRQQFKQSRIEQHKNYQSIIDKHYDDGRKRTKGIMVIVIMIILIIAILLAIFQTPKNGQEKAPAHHGEKTAISYIGSIHEFEKM